MPAAVVSTCQGTSFGSLRLFILSFPLCCVLTFRPPPQRLSQGRRQGSKEKTKSKGKTKGSKIKKKRRLLRRQSSFVPVYYRHIIHFFFFLRSGWPPRGQFPPIYTFRGIPAPTFSIKKTAMVGISTPPPSVRRLGPGGYAACFAYPPPEHRPALRFAAEKAAPMPSPEAASL